MSSFKRKSSSKPTILPPGSRLCPSSPLKILTSTGIPSLDDILGGGLPLSCTQLILAPEVHSAYGELVQKYFIAQGLVCGQEVCVIDDEAEDLVRKCMWIPAPGAKETGDGDGSEGGEIQSGEKIKIAWRYEQMKQFQTTVSSTPSAEEYCTVFDLTSKVPPLVLESAYMSGTLQSLTVNTHSQQILPSTSIVLQRITEVLESSVARNTPSKPLRVCVPSLGSPLWGDLNPRDVLCFLHSILALVRRYPHAVASVGLSPHICAESWGGRGWLQKLGWLSDAALVLSAFTGNPSLSSTFPTHHGLLQILTLPSLHTLLQPSDKYSTLRGLSASSVSSGENNLAFKCTRKRLVFETLHLDLEGGVGERRTTAPASAVTLESASLQPTVAPTPVSRSKYGAASVEVTLDTTVTQARQDAVEVSKPSTGKQRKKVAFRSDRPDLYDF